MSTLQSETGARRSPIQQRSRERVDRILAATRELLREDGVRAVTTTRIAERAGLPVGSVYQYFPDKTAILSGMYADYLAQIRAELARFERDGPYEQGWRTYFNVLTKRLKRIEASDGLDIELLAACQAIPELARLNEQHSEVIAASFARILRRFGSRWSLARLRRLALFMYRLNNASLVHRQFNHASARESEHWGATAMLAVMGICLPDARPAGPAAGTLTRTRPRESRRS